MTLIKYEKGNKATIETHAGGSVKANSKGCSISRRNCNILDEFFAIDFSQL